MRLDIYIKENKNIKSRARAKLLIESDRVKVNSVIKKNCNYEVKSEDIVEAEDLKFVSRAGYKLEYAFEVLLDKQAKDGLTIENKLCLDIGSSTGGFTDYLLQQNAKEVFCVDVGIEQFDQDLLKNNTEKIKLFESTDIRDVVFSENKNFDIVVCDVSFISLTHIIPSIKKYLSDKGFGVILFKPQFEVGAGNTKKGIVKDSAIMGKVTQERVKDFELAGIKVLDIFKSGILGGDGNVEYIFYIRKY